MAQGLKILVTGASGFVGAATIRRFTADPDVTLLAASRIRPADLPNSVDFLKITDLSVDFDWSPSLSGIDLVIHTVARVHVMKDTASDPLQAFRLTNVEATLNLARQAAAAGVHRFVFLSSIKVNGELTLDNQAFTADDIPAPLDFYGISKLEAEQGLQEIGLQTGMQIVIIRPPLVYGPGVKGNFRTMMHWLRLGIPLPLGAIRDNRRSMVALENLTDLIHVCAFHPAAANQIFLVSDGEDLSTTLLLQRLGVALGRPTRLIPIPKSILKAIAKVAGKQSVTARLCESLCIDISKTCRLLGWKPVANVEVCLKLTADYFNSVH